MFNKSQIPKFSLVFLGIFLLLSNHAFSLTDENSAQKHLLDNGMVVIIKEDPSAGVAALVCLVGAGSTTEAEYTGSGISHFIEHMLFKGTKLRKPGEIATNIRALGGEIHGFTSFDYTGYGVVIPSQHFNEALEVLSDALMNSTFAAKEMKKERGVILNEIRQNRDDPDRFLSRLLFQTAFTTHPYRHPIIGYEAVFRKLERKDLLDYYHRMYCPNNMVLTAVGDIDSSRVLERIKKAFSDFKLQPLVPTASLVEAPQMSKRSLVKEQDIKLAHLVLGFHGPPLAHPDLYAMDVLATILGQGRSSRLYKTVKEEMELVHSINAWSYTPKDPGIFGISALMDEEKLDETVEVVLEEIEELKTGFIYPEELVKARKAVLRDFFFGQEAVEKEAAQLAIDEALTGDFDFSKRYVDGIGSVRAQDVKEVAEKYLSEDNLSIVVLLPKQAPSTKEGAKIRPKEQSIKRGILKNGLSVLLKEDPGLPICSISVLFKGGVRLESKPGLSNFTARMLLKGTKSRTAAQIAEESESLGASIGSYSANNSFGFSMELLSEDLERGLEILADCLLNSNFPKDQVEKARSTILAQIKNKEDDIFQLASKKLSETLYQVHPYRFQSEGTAESVSKIKREDILDFYKAYVVAPNMVLAIFGDIQIDETFKMVKDKFEYLSSTSPSPVDIPQEPKQASRREAVQPMDKLQAAVVLGFHTIDIKDEDRYVFEVITNILSGQGGRLFDAVRERRGLTYAVGSYQVLGLDPGYYVIYAGTHPKYLEDVREELIRQISLLKTTQVRAEELTRAKTNLIGLHEIGLQTNGALAFQSGLDELYGLGYQNYRDYARKIKAVTSEDVLRAARQYFDLNTSSIVVVKTQ